MVHDFGYHVLVIDLRAHGESGGSHSTAGFFERHDLNQVINDLRAADVVVTNWHTFEPRTQGVGDVRGTTGALEGSGAQRPGEGLGGGGRGPRGGPEGTELPRG